jgi:hypothetical protein
MQQRNIVRQHQPLTDPVPSGAVQLGIAEYKWLAVPGASCDIGTRNDGRIFSYLNPGPDGHPREGRCNQREGCLCVAQSVV